MQNSTVTPQAPSNFAEPGTVTMTEPQKYRTSWTDTELLQAVFPEPNWAVNGLIPEGLTILGGRPKVGKSLLALQLALAVKTGGRFLDAEIVPGNVLYLALEDGGKRLQKRMRALEWTNGGPYSVQFEVEIPPLHKPEGMSALFLHLARGEYRLVVLDTIERAMPGTDKSDEKIMGPVYGNLQSLAIKRGLSILIIDHLRKPNGLYSDPVDDVLGSTAKTGIADTCMALYKEQGKSGHNLRGRGRDVEDFDLKIQFDPQTACYQLIGAAGDIELTERRTEIILALQDLGISTSRQIAKYLNQDPSNTNKRLTDLANSQKIIRKEIDGKIYYEALP
jgi:hypothetical protein